jgi:uncharacterized membrane protein
MMMMHKLLLTFFCLFAGLSPLLALPPIEMADGLRAEGKIYVVVLSIVMIFIGFLIYLIMTNRKISRLEKEIEQTEPNQAEDSIKDV